MARPQNRIQGRLWIDNVFAHKAGIDSDSAVSGGYGDSRANFGTGTDLRGAFATALVSESGARGLRRSDLIAPI